MGKVLSISLLVLISILNAETSDDSLFRGISWKSSKEVVKRIEKCTLFLEADDLLIYRTKIAGVDCLVTYSFFYGQLYNGSYNFNFTQEYSDGNFYINEFENTNNTLTESYGEATKIEEVWRNEEFKNDKTKYGLAVSIGHLYYKYTWKLDNIVITHTLQGSNYSINRSLNYYNRPLLAMKSVKKKQME